MVEGTFGIVGLILGYALARSFTTFGRNSGSPAGSMVGIQQGERKIESRNGEEIDSDRSETGADPYLGNANKRIRLEEGDKCPVCLLTGMYHWRGIETARACVICGHVEERQCNLVNDNRPA